MMTNALKALAAALLLTLCAAHAAIAPGEPDARASLSDVDRAVAAFKGRSLHRGTGGGPAGRRRLADVGAGLEHPRQHRAEFMGEFDEARTFYDRVGALTPDDPGIVYRAASLALRVGEYDRALAQLDRLLALHPQQVRWLFQYAPTRFQAGSCATIRRSSTSCRPSSTS